MLPGVHRANVILVRGRNITVKGCGRQTRVIPRESNLNAPIFSIVDSQNITLEHMDLVSFGGIAVVVQSSQPGLSKAVEIHNNRIVGCRQAIQVRHGTQVGIHHNQIRVVDRENSDVAVFLQTEDSLIERNDIGVVSPEQFPPLEEPPEDGIADPADPCADPEIIYSRPAFLGLFLDRLFGVLVTFFPRASYKALGGIQIAAASERVRVWDNRISGGAGNGITLGGVLAPDLAEPVEEPEEPAHVILHPREEIQGDVTGPSGALAGIVLLFTRTDNSGLVSTTTDSGGMFFVDAGAGEYRVDVTTPGYTISEIESRERDEFGISHTSGLKRSSQRRRPTSVSCTKSTWTETRYLTWGSAGLDFQRHFAAAAITRLR